MSITRDVRKPAEGIEKQTGAARSPAVLRMLGMVLIVCSLPSGCASFKDVPELMEIQNAPGFYPKTLFYCGSSETYHYFEQETPLADLTLLSPHVRRLKAWRWELSLPEGAEYLHFYYKGSEDPRRQRMRIRITQMNPGRGTAEYVPPGDER